MSPALDTDSNTAITASHLTKTYGLVKAVDDVSFSVREGEIFGVLGPNGAGKTTTVECLTGLRRPDSGSIKLLGRDPSRDHDALHAVVGVQLQASAVQDRLKVKEILDLYRSFYHHPADVRELVDGLGLGEKRDAQYRALSGGQKQRLSVALALIGRPRIAVLDEMTTGLDPQARRDTWALIERVRERGATIVLVSHFMEEAERLCDRVALIDRGRIIATDSPQGLAEKVAGGKRVRFTPSRPFPDALLTERPEVKSLEHQGRHVEVIGSGELVNVVILTLAREGIEAKDVQMGTANLEDAFVRLTGRLLHDAGEGPTP
ncbi:MAG: ABC transporter ATP-binding protein [Armatimonadetes bacterium]|nr:ABC transporter ATP-binding protein [Armatimonadota bacterium]